MSLLRRAAIVACSLAVCGPAMTQPPPVIVTQQPPVPLPPSPFGDDPHGVYDQRSTCWIWDANSTGQNPAEKEILFSNLHCEGKPIEGEADLIWVRRNNREHWSGTFTNGRFTGKSDKQYSDAKFEGSYRDSKREGRALLTFNDGGTRDETYSDGLQDGHSVQIFASGDRIEGNFEKGQRVGLWIKAMRDGSKMEVMPVSGQNYLDSSGTFVTAAGERLKGAYAIPHSDRANNPPLVYPPLAIRLDEQGTVYLSFKVMEDGSVQDMKLARTSGHQRLDEAAMTQVAAWRFIPATLDGKPMASYMLMNQVFHLNPAQ